MIADVGHGAPQVVFGGRARDEIHRVAPRDLQDFGVAQNVGDTQARQTGLFGPEEFPWTAQLQVHLRNVEAVGGFHQRAYAFPRGIVHLVGHQEAVTLRRAAAHAAAQLVQLRQAESLRLFHHHHAGVGHIHAHFDHRGRDQNLDLAFLEALHDGFLLIGAQPAVHQAHRDLREDLAREVLVLLLRSLHRLRLGLLDHGVDHVGLPAFLDLRLHEAVDLLDVVAGGMFGDDGLAPGRHLVDHANVEIAVHRQSERARDRRGGHHQDVRRHALLHQAEALQDAEAMLLVDDGKAQILELDVLLDPRVRADGDVDQVFGAQFLELHFFTAGEAAGQQGGDVAQLTKYLFGGEAVLRGQDLGRREHRYQIPD